MIALVSQWFEERDWRRRVDDAMVRMLAARSPIDRERRARQLLDAHNSCPLWLVRKLERERGLR